MHALKQRHILQSERVPTYFIACGLFILFYLLTGLTASWGPPERPLFVHYSLGLRFLLAIGIYCLGCAFFFYLRLFGMLSGKELPFLLLFCISFIPVAVFSILVATGYPLEVLRRFTSAADISVWLAAGTAGTIRFKSLEASGFHRGRTIAGLCAIFVFAASGAAFFVPGIPSILLYVVRLLLLAILIILTTAHSGKTGNVEATIRRYRLSPREGEVLLLLLSGKTNNQIAEELFISLSTAKTHVASILQKMKAKNRLEISVRWGNRPLD